MSATDDRLAAFAAELAPADVPVHVEQRVKHMLLDALASGLAGRATEERLALEAMAERITGRGSSSVIGGESLSLLGATLLNGYQITAATVCDVHRPTLCHVAPEVVPAALAVAEERDADGATLLAALAAGFEITVRVATALGAERSRARGWHLPGVAGPFGAAAAAGRIIGLGPVAMRDALGHAGSQAAGTFAALGSAGVKLHQARGALSGLLAAAFAEAGLTGSGEPLTATDGGLLSAYADGGQPAALTDGLGEQWWLEEISLRRWPAASGLQAVISGVLALVERQDLHATDVTRLEIKLPGAAHAMHAEREWSNQLAALQSARYVAAVTLFDRRCWLEQYTPERRADAALTRFAREQVSVSRDPALATGSATVEVELSNGGRSEIHVRVAPGDPRAPLDDETLGAKLADAAASAGLPRDRVSELGRLIGRLETLDSCRRLTRALRQAG